jgi:hypothetical protein
MAGSWDHMTTSKGKLLNNEQFTQMIENLGDAYEAAEECYGMVWYLAWQLAEIGDREGKPSHADILGVITEAVQHHQYGLKLGGVQKER